DLVSKKRVDEREGHPCRLDPSVRPAVRIRRHVQRGPDAGVTRPRQELGRGPTHESRGPPEARAVKVVVAVEGLRRDVGETERAVRSERGDQRTASAGPRKSDRGAGRPSRFRPNDRAHAVAAVGLPEQVSVRVPSEDANEGCLRTELRYLEGEVRRIASRERLEGL